MPSGFLIRRARRFFADNVLHVKDTPHRIALGAACGIFIAFTPTVGFHMALTLLSATALRANKLVALAFTWVSNPLTFLPVYAPSYWLGSHLLGGQYSWQSFKHAAAVAASPQTGWIEHIQAWWTATREILAPLWLGSIIMATLAAVLSYFLVRKAVTLYRARRQDPADLPQTPASS